MAQGSCSPFVLSSWTRWSAPFWSPKQSPLTSVAFWPAYCTDDQKTPDIRLTRFCDPPQPLLSSRGVLARNKSQPSSEVAAPPEGFHVRCKGLKRQGCDWPYPRQCLQTPRRHLQAGVPSGPSHRYEPFALRFAAEALCIPCSRSGGSLLHRSRE